MTIQEAIKSGLDYKRKGSKTWIEAGSENKYSKDDLLANDYEIRTEPLEVWLWQHKGGRFGSAFLTKKDCEYNYEIEPGRAIKFREVIE